MKLIANDGKVRRKCHRSDIVLWSPPGDEGLTPTAQNGNHAKVVSLQRLMLRSRANTLVSVRRVTEHNAGPRDGRDRRTARLDLTDKADLDQIVHLDQG